MSDGQKPTHYVELKNKQNDEKIFIADAWQSKYGYNISFRKEYTRNDGTKSVGVAAIKLTDGTIIKPSDWYVSLNEKKGAPSGKSQTKHTHEYGSDSLGDDDIPF